MTRLTLLGFAGVLFAAPVSAQTAPDSLAADSVAVDSVAAGPSYDTATARERYREGFAAAEANSLDVALSKFDQALVADPTFPPALYGRANALGRLGRLEDARLGYEAAIAASQGEANARYRTAAETALAEVVTAIAQAAEVARQTAAVEAQTAAIAQQTAAIEAATALLAADPVTPEAAQQAYDLLEQARTAGYDANNVAFYYAKALNALTRGAEALPYAEQALAANTDPDASVFYIQIGIANRFAGNDPAARAAFEAAKAGSWAGWAEHYLAEMGDAPMPGTDG
ncbi:MAG TPA: tetratricopeptide repeat protein [Rubricoccaceae bacterium]